ncbi:hypothetical protein SMICM304S_02296 [Streptomyces microflavus]
MLMATAMNRTNGSRSTPSGAKESYIPRARSVPSPSGRATLTMETSAAVPLWALSEPSWISCPTRNMKMSSPRLPSSPR